MRRVKVTLVLTEEDYDNMPVALGFAYGALLQDGRSTEDRELARRARKRIDALWLAWTSNRTVEVIGE